jgi:hypothetical protein
VLLLFASPVLTVARELNHGDAEARRRRRK